MFCFALQFKSRLCHGHGWTPLEANENLWSTPGNDPGALLLSYSWSAKQINVVFYVLMICSLKCCVFWFVVTFSVLLIFFVKCWIFKLQGHCVHIIIIVYVQHWKEVRTILFPLPVLCHESISLCTIKQYSRDWLHLGLIGATTFSLSPAQPGSGDNSSTKTCCQKNPK